MGQRWTFFAHSAQQMKCPHGKKTVFTSASMHTLHVLSSFSFSFSSSIDAVGSAQPKHTVSTQRLAPATSTTLLRQVTRNQKVQTSLSISTYNMIVLTKINGYWIQRKSKPNPYYCNKNHVVTYAKISYNPADCQTPSERTRLSVCHQGHQSIFTRLQVALNPHRMTHFLLTPNKYAQPLNIIVALAKLTVSSSSSDVNSDILIN